MSVRTAKTPFDRALFVVADCLSEARYCEECGAVNSAGRLYAFAEAYALRSGFLELTNLVWAYSPHTRNRTSCGKPRG